MASLAQRILGGLAASAIAAALLPGFPPAAAARDGLCRIPDRFLGLAGELDRTERLVTRREAVRVVVLASGDPLAGSLERALERRLPQIPFEVDVVSSTGLATEDVQNLRFITARLKPDLVVWQVGVRDAMAASDVSAFGEALDRASSWVEKTGSDLVIVDPPFVPRVQHERIYAPYVGEIAEVGRAERVPVVPRYAFTRYLAEGGERAMTHAELRPCATDYTAEAISRLVR